MIFENKYMGHDILYCDFCDTAVMEGRNGWHCDRCGAVCHGKEWIKEEDYNEKQDSSNDI